MTKKHIIETYERENMAEKRQIDTETLTKKETERWTYLGLDEGKTDINITVSRVQNKIDGSDIQSD